MIDVVFPNTEYEDGFGYGCERTFPKKVDEVEKGIENIAIQGSGLSLCMFLLFMSHYLCPILELVLNSTIASYENNSDR